MDKFDKFLTILFSGLFIIPLGIGIALKKQAALWGVTGWNLPNILIAWGLFGWLIVLTIIIVTYEMLRKGSSFHILIASNLGIYGGAVIGGGLAFFLFNFMQRGDPVKVSGGGAVLGLFWGFSLFQLKKPGGLYGIIISISVALISWPIICLSINKLGLVSCVVAFGVTGVVVAGFIGGIIGPIVYFIRHTDIDKLVVNE